MTQDRLTREVHNAVQQLMGAEAFELTAASQEMVNGAEQIVRQLLRREHAAVVRLVKLAQGTDAHAWVGGQVAMITGPGKGQWIKRKTLLTALARRAK